MGCLATFIGMILGFIGSVFGLVFGIIGSVVGGIGIVIVVPMIICTVLILVLIGVLWFFTQLLRGPKGRREPRNHHHYHGNSREKAFYESDTTEGDSNRYSAKDESSTNGYAKKDANDETIIDVDENP